ncbi:MAG: zinc ribbon domain-containing protein [Bacteroidales bacterium]|nr:zinc ribbon domain-containing protein [Bacteroidales bacterium]
MRPSLSWARVGVVLLCLLFLLSSCYNPPQHIILSPALGEWVDSVAVDSASQRLKRPYGIGFNFVVHADSLLLQEERPMHWCQGVAETSDSLWVWKNNPLVVAAIIVIPEDCVDSVWVKVARDQYTMGWTHERDLLTCATPDDPISWFINHFSDYHTLWLLGILAMVLVILLLYLRHHHHVRAVLFDDIPSAYPTFLTIMLVCSAWLYAYIQEFEPQHWVTFYFSPTLNPLSQPSALCVFLFTVWGLLLLGIASVENAFELLSPLDALLYLLALAGICSVLYMLVSLTAWSWWCHLICLAYIVMALYRYFRFARARYYCGNCHRKLQHKGVCPYCGVVNE